MPAAPSNWIAACALCAALSAPAVASDVKIGAIGIDRPWSRATPKSAPVAGGYLTLVNTGEMPDRLVAVKSDIAEKVEIHESSVTDGVARMRALPQGLAIGAKASVELAPDRTHLMFIKPVRQLKQGERFTARLTFEKAGTVEVEFVVQSMGARSPAAGGHEGH